MQKLTHCNLRLAEATKTIQAEREEKTGLHRAMERLQAEMHEATKRLDELRHVKQEAEARLLSSEEKHRIELVCNEKELRDEAAKRQTLDRRLADLRAELERLQAENASEWGRRDRLETERLALERENRKLRAQVSDLTDRIGTRFGAGLDDGGGGTADSPSPNHHLNGESNASAAAELLLEERTRELIELRHAHNKLKKALQERSVELSHSLRRSEV